MPPDVPRPEDVELDIDYYTREAQSAALSEKAKAYWAEVIRERSRSPLAIKAGIERRASDGTLTVMHWMKARGIPKYGPAFQKCILGYMSDMQFIGVAAKALGLRRDGKSPGALSMTSSLDHTIFFYSDDFDCSDWLLYVVESPRTGSGRGVVIGRMYTRDGTLVAVTTQEGVVRSDAGRPRKEKSKL